MAENEKLYSATNKAMALCANHEYCSSDIRLKLIAWGLSGEDAEKVISALVREKFIDDSRYARAFASDKFRQNKWGKVKITSHLRTKNLGSAVIDEALEGIDEEEYLRMIRETIKEHRRFVKAKNRYDLKGKLLRFGLSRGFESHLLYDILNEGDD